MMILPELVPTWRVRIIGHKDNHKVDYESKTYVKTYDSACLWFRKEFRSELNY
jgi:hypothetical protein